MKLHTSVPPRMDGIVKVQGLNGKQYTFEGNGRGTLSCDVDDEATVIHLLRLGTFTPADVKDDSIAVSLLRQAEEQDRKAGLDDDSDDFADDGDDDFVNMNALPLEAETPPAPKKRGRKPKMAVAE